MYAERLSRTLAEVSGQTIKVDNPVQKSRATRGPVRRLRRVARPERIYYGITPASRRYFTDLTGTWRRLAPA
jgi:hypothetical protein